MGYDDSADIFRFGYGGFSGNLNVNVDSLGRVGIGTTVPGAKLVSQIASGFSATFNNFNGDALQLVTTTAAGIGNYGAGISFSRLGVAVRNAGISAVQTGSDSDLVGLAFFTHPSTTQSNGLVEQMRIDHAGNVGINVTDPDSKLEVNGDVHIDGDLFFEVDGSGLPYGCMYVDGTQAIIVALTQNTIAEVFDDDTTSLGDGWLGGDFNLITFPTGGDEHFVSVTKPGFYRVVWSLSFNTANPGANVEIHGGIAVDGTAIRKP